MCVYLRFDISLEILFRVPDGAVIEIKREEKEERDKSRKTKIWDFLCSGTAVRCKSHAGFGIILTGGRKSDSVLFSSLASPVFPCELSRRKSIFWDDFPQ